MGGLFGSERHQGGSSGGPTFRTAAVERERESVSVDECVFVEKQRSANDVGGEEMGEM